MLDKLHKARSYDNIVQLVHDNVLPPIELNKKYQQSSDDKTDPVAMHLFPNDHPPNVVPTHTLGMVIVFLGLCLMRFSELKIGMSKFVCG